MFASACRGHLGLYSMSESVRLAALSANRTCTYALSSSHTANSESFKRDAYRGRCYNNGESHDWEMRADAGRGSRDSCASLEDDPVVGEIKHDRDQQEDEDNCQFSAVPPFFGLFVQDPNCE